MAIQLTGSNGLFTRLGKIGITLADVNGYQSGLLPTDIEDILTQYSDDEALTDGINAQLVAAQSSAGIILSYLQQLAINTVNEMVFQDNPQSSDSNIYISLVELIRQMQASSDSVLAMTVSATAAAASGNQGNGACVCTVYRPDGKTQQDVIAETVTLAVSQDSSNGTTAAGNETFTVSGTVAEPNALAFDYPLGSGATVTLSAIDASSDNSAGTVLTNGDFEDWTGNTPDDWTITVGTAGVQILKSSVQFYTGAFSCNFVGDGATLTQLTQEVTVTNYSLYACNGWIKMSATPAAGVLQFSLIDGNGNVINDNEGNPNSFTQALTSISTTWTAVNGVFRTPYVLPAMVKLRIRLSTALESGKNLFLDRVGLGAMTQLYNGGPAFAVFSGSDNFYYPDSFAATVSNSFGSGGTINTFQILFDRLFNMKSLGLLLPYAASGYNTVPDSLIN